MNIQKTARTCVLAISILGLGACSNLTQTQQSVLTGAAIGTAVGAAGTVMTGGCVACGAAVGGVVGAGAGYVVDQIKK